MQILGITANDSEQSSLANCWHNAATVVRLGAASTRDSADENDWFVRKH